LISDADYPGIALMAISLGTLEYVLEEGTRWNWFDDGTIKTCAWIRAIALRPKTPIPEWTLRFDPKSGSMIPVLVDPRLTPEQA